jgi:F0F1-type ATP synthase assembly protein I
MDKQKTSPQKPSDPKKPNLYLKYTAMATQMGVTIAGGVLLGIWLDKKANFSVPWFTLILTLVSVFAAIYLSIKDFLKK